MGSGVMAAGSEDEQGSLAPDEEAVVEALRAGDEAAFHDLYERHHRALWRVARGYARSDAVADEVVQETWLGVIKGIQGFEGRSSLKTWIFRILLNVARTRGAREARSVPFAALADDGDENPVPEDRFFPARHERFAGHWRLGPAPWGIPDERALATEMRTEILAAIDALGDKQRLVITMRDVGGWSAAEVCNAMGLSEVNQRVLLHRARTAVRAAVEERLGAMETT